MLGAGNYGTLDLSVALRYVRDVALRGNMGLGGGGGLDERDVAVDADAWKRRGWDEGRKAVNGRCPKSEEMAGVPRSCQWMGCVRVARSILSASDSAAAAVDDGINQRSSDTAPAGQSCDLCAAAARGSGREHQQAAATTSADACKRCSCSMTTNGIMRGGGRGVGGGDVKTNEST